ncbi:hypothetical protein GN958_ATG21041 [Phytophthora infestans]|uniref:Uncharacterized protein n=1 Tax=Phytophthora infestans TaxID=4787 RepID=A0A8S9TQ70_PHYIN|nr:hypothetical protein GN958_ATG21041 [Phytophthora infestans]
MPPSSKRKKHVSNMERRLDGSSYLLTINPNFTNRPSSTEEVRNSIDVMRSGAGLLPATEQDDVEENDALTSKKCTQNAE